MHVKLEPSEEIDISALIDFETIFREELFGTAETSESNSDDDVLSKLTSNELFSQGKQSVPHRNFVRKSTSSSSSSESGSNGFSIGEYESVLLDFQDGANGIKMEEPDFKYEEAFSPEMEFLAECGNSRINQQDILSHNDYASLFNSLECQMPESPPITPPEGFHLNDESPPHTPPSGAFPALVHSPTASSSLNIAVANSAQHAVNRVPKRSPDTRPTVPSTVKKKVALAPKVQPIKLVTIKANSGDLPLISKAVSNTTTSPPAKTFTVIPNSTSSLITVAPASSSTSTKVSSAQPTISLPPIAPALSVQAKLNTLDIRAFKRHERMIKNRESASQSRKRKKMYVQSLEEENSNLKEDNKRLHDRIAFLEKENFILKGLKKANISRPSTTLLGVAFLFLLNVSMIFTRSSSPQNLPEELYSPPFLQDNVVPSAREPLNTKSILSRSLLWIPSAADENVSDEEISLANVTHICPLSMNASESQRIEEELRDWFVPPLKRKQEKVPLKRIKPKQFHPKTQISRESAVAQIMEEQEERFKPLDEESLHLIELLKLDRALSATVKTGSSRYNYLYHGEDVGSIPPLDSRESLRSILEFVKRRDDTYYVVSLSKDHLLVPALSKNGTVTRPRMSLLISPPNSMQNGSHSEDPSQVGFMQIDCEVTHTQVIQVSRDFVPPSTAEKESAPLRNSTSESLSRASLRKRRKMKKNQVS